MVLALLRILGDWVKAENPYFDTHAVNAIKLPNGTVINFTNNQEKQFLGISDCEGSSFYLRFDPVIEYEENPRKMSSCDPSFIGVAKCKLVAWSFDGRQPLDSDKVIKKLVNDLQTYPFGRTKVLIKKSNHSFRDVFKEETLKEPPTEFMCVSVDFNLRYYTENVCEDCDVFYIPEC